MKNFTSIILLTFASTFITAQSAVDIKIDYKNYNNDTLLLAYNFGEKILIQDTIYATSPSKFEYKRDSLLKQGTYMLVTKPSNSFFQILIGDEQQFEVSTDFENKEETIITGSKENELFYAYVDYLSEQRNQLAQQDSAVSRGEITKEQGDQNKAALAAKVELHQKDMISTHPNTVFSMIIGANMEIDIPEFEGTPEEVEMKNFLHYKEHFFDGTNLGDPKTLRSPFIHQKVTTYMDKLIPISADSIINAVDYILDQMKPSEETFQYYLSHFLNTYGNSKYIGLDAVYVHLALEYYEKGLAPWAKPDNLKEIVNNAWAMKQTLIGLTAPDFTIKKEDGTDFTLSKFEANYTVLVFWAPDCGHCTKAMPYLVKYQEKYADKGAKVVSICNKTGKKYASCWEGVIEKGMESFINLGDEYMKSRVVQKYYVRSTPLILILDKDKKILLKKVPAENIDSVMEKILEQAEQDKELE